MEEDQEDSDVYQPPRGRAKKQDARIQHELHELRSPVKSARNTKQMKHTRSHASSEEEPMGNINTLQQAAVLNSNMTPQTHNIPKDKNVKPSRSVASKPKMPHYHDVRRTQQTSAKMPKNPKSKRRKSKWSMSESDVKHMVNSELSQDMARARPYSLSKIAKYTKDPDQSAKKD